MAGLFVVAGGCLAWTAESTAYPQLEYLQLVCHTAAVRARGCD